MKYPKLSYHLKDEQGHVSSPKEFEDLPDVIKLDLLYDWMHDLESKIEQILDKDV